MSLPSRSGQQSSPANLSTKESSIETILVASEPGNIFYSDDERLRYLAKREFNVNGIWTQALLMKCLDEDFLERGRYNECVIHLVNYSYRHTSIDAYVLVDAAKQSDWSPRPPYTKVLKVLGEQHSDERSALIVGTNFLYELWKQPTILVQKRDQIILALLDAITSKRNPRVIMTKLAKMLERRFYIIPLALKEVIPVCLVYAYSKWQSYARSYSLSGDWRTIHLYRLASKQRK